VVADTSAIYAGTGAQVGTATLSATGTGTAQTLLGNVTLNFAVGGTAAPLPSQTLGVAGTANDNLTYTLNF
jgi:spore coat protein U-like protein